MLEDTFTMLENAEITVGVSEGDATIQGRVVACDPDIGITIVDAENSENYIVCIDCRNKYHIREDAVAAKSLFDYIFSTIIKTGRLNIDEAVSFVHKMNYRLGASPSAENCVFNQ